MSPPGKKLLLVLFGAVVLLSLFVITRQPETTREVTTAHSLSIKRDIKPLRGHTSIHRPTSVTPTNESSDDAIPPAERERMNRMAQNLLKPALILGPAAATRQRQEWVQRFRKESDPLLREEIVTEMVQLDDIETIKTMRELLAAETDSGVRQQLVLMLGYMRATVSDMADVGAALMLDYQRCGNREERGRIMEVISNLPTTDSARYLHTAFFSDGASPEDRFHAAEGFFKLTPRVSVDPNLVSQITERLKWDARSASTEQERLLAAHALATPGQDNKGFLSELLKTEGSSEVRKFLTLASQQYPSH